MTDAAQGESPRWTPVGNAADWPAEGAKLVTVGPRKIGVYQHAGAWYALKDMCPHAGVGLSKGPIADKMVMCVGHGWRFNLETGKVLGIPGDWRVGTYPVRVVDGVVEIGV
ncbi:MAG: Rieske 2Fe-2S domain-containing protein [Planctomycetes bacterium]|nr:Rieske 2Fe-2S domain-containing protein [Planctomycetota bacterium]